MRTVGVDLSAESKQTAVAIIAWNAGSAVVASVATGQTDAEIVDAAAAADKVGIDCPLGWPEPFIDFVTAHRDRGPLAAHDLAGRKNLAYRLTDHVVVATTGLRPLSVSADRIGHAAMRAAGLLADLARAGHDVDRAGAGLVVEAYPTAALKRWQLRYAGYKGRDNGGVREALVDDLLAAMSWLDLGAAESLCRNDDDAFDAVICALIARASALGMVTTPDETQLERAATEGWIAVPTCELADLIR